MSTTMSRSRFRKAALVSMLAAAAVSVASGCAPLVTQSPSGALRPSNVKTLPAGERVMLDGHDVVAYFTEGKHRPGSTDHRSDREGVTFLFASADHKARFEANPSAYMPQYHGYCANGIVYGIPWGGDADSWRVIDGKLYIFGGRVSRESFLLDPKASIQLADKYWAEEVKGSNALWQRSKRLVFRVPHYKTGEELAQLVDAKQGK